MSGRCPECGARLAKHARFCQDCGGRIIVSAPPVTSVPAPAPAPIIPREPSKPVDVVASSAKWLSIAFAAFVFVVISCAFYALVVVGYVSLGYEGVVNALAIATAAYVTVLGFAFLVLRRTVLAERVEVRERHRRETEQASASVTPPPPAEAGVVKHLIAFPFKMAAWFFMGLITVIVVCALFALSVVTITSLGGGLVAGLLGGFLVVAGVAYATYLFFDRIGATR